MTDDSKDKDALEMDHDEASAHNARPWTSSEIQLLRSQSHLGYRVLAVMLDRSEGAVRWQAHAQRISLRQKGSRAGLILGQPRGVAWLGQTGHGMSPERLEQLRAESLSGEIDIAVLEERIRENIYGRSRPICPSCTQRPQERESTGLCEACHLRELARAHRDEVDRREARRDLWRARQESSRHRRKGDFDSDVEVVEE